MRKITTFINITLDGFCNHEAMMADEELHEHANDYFRGGDTIIFGRKTYQLMEDAWPAIAKNPTGVKATDEFAVLMDNISKIVFSHTLKKLQWETARLAQYDLETTVKELKQQTGKNILVGGTTLISSLLELGLIDEIRLLIQPIVLGNGVALFRDIKERVDLKLLETKTLHSGVVIHYYEPTNRRK
ncbi:MAG TPA: dihydrofolate reductase family protein [Puia sp.]|nr:dihydrofolate reductase family protein [Puia sp.]